MSKRKKVASVAVRRLDRMLNDKHGIDFSEDDYE
jgi:hypothetical protein